MRKFGFESFDAMLGFSACVSLVLHAFVLFGIGFKFPDALKLRNSTPPLEIVLVNAKTRNAPENAEVLAQANLEGGGDSEEKRRLKSPLPAMQMENSMQNVESASKKVAQLEAETRRLLTQIKSSKEVPVKTPREQGSPDPTQDLVEKSLEIARLEAQIDKDTDAYQHKPRIHFYRPRAKEYRFARYVEDWRLKVERIGNLNYPEEARREHIYGTLQLSVYINADGSLNKVEVERSSGQKVLDDAAIRIVKLSSPYAPFPEDIKRDFDVLCITRSWMFTRSDRLEQME